MDRDPSPGVAPSQLPPGDRLDSWKEIAAYLRRDVRTVQRWQERASLPVHRHVDRRQRGVFAFKSELDAWANQFREEGENPPDDHVLEGPQPATSRRRTVWLAAGLLACLGVSLTVWTLLSRASSPPVPFKERDWVLVAGFETRDSDGEPDSSLQYVLERELAVSTFVNVVPRPRVQDVLRLMRRADDSRLTPELAREVAERDGNIQVIVAGRVNRAGEGGLLTVEIVNPRTGTTLRSRSIRVATEDQMLDGVRRLADWARRALGEDGVVSRRDDRLPPVTTSSLAALRHFAKADEAINRNHFQAAIVLLESALREDPDFALAHMRLAYALTNAPDAPSLQSVIDAHRERAFALANNVTDKERLRIVASYHMNPAGAEKAMAAWEALVRLDPDDWDARSSLAGLYFRVRRIPEALREMETVARLRPHDFRTAGWTAQTWAQWAGDADRARPHVERAKSLWRSQRSGFSSETGLANLPPGYARDVAWLLLFDGFDKWRAGDIRGMLLEVQQVLDSDPLPTPVDRDALLTIAVGMQMSAGRLRDARSLSGRMFQERLRNLHLAVVADAVDDFATLRRHMSKVPVEGEARPLRFVRAGLYPQAENAMARNQSAQGFLEAGRGELALRRGRTADGIEQLRQSVALGASNTLSDRYLAAESLARALERTNRRSEALAVLEATAAAEPRYATTGISGAFWLRVLGRLALAYRDRGDVLRAQAVEDRLRRLLVVADPDHPLVAQLQAITPRN
jgi:tetratricopeptide (TPR) repeat protein